MSDDDGVFTGSRGDGEFDLGVCSCEFREEGLNETAAQIS